MNQIKRPDSFTDDDDEPVSTWFELSYSSYLVLQRSLMEALPVRWQREMVALLNEMDAEFDTSEICGSFWVRAKDWRGRFIDDPLREYRRPNRDLIERLRQRKEASHEAS